MDISIFLAKTLGLYYIIASIAILLKKDCLRESVRDLMNRKTLFFMWGFLDLFFGALLISAHSIWTLDYRIVVTIFAYIALLKGIFKLLAPQKAMALTQKFDNDSYLNIISLILLVIGLYLAYVGFGGAGV